MLGFGIATTLGRPASVTNISAAPRDWTPADLGSTLAWWDAEYGITQSGAQVTRWVDRVGGLALTQDAASAQPEFAVNARNGKAGVVFGGRQYLGGGGGNLPIEARPHTIFVAAHSAGTDTQYGAIVAWGDSGKNASRCLQMRGRTTSIAASFKNNDHLATSIWAGLDRSVAHQMDADGNGLFWVDGVSENPHRITGVATVRAMMSLGAPVDSAAYAVSGVTAQQIVISDTVLSTADRQRLEGWASWKTGRRGTDLPANHPYKTLQPKVGA